MIVIARLHRAIVIDPLSHSYNPLQGNPVNHDILDESWADALHQGQRSLLRLNEHHYRSLQLRDRWFRWSQYRLGIVIDFLTSMEQINRDQANS